MSTAALSSAQFGGPDPSPASTVEPLHEPRTQLSGAPPLSYSASSNSSAKQASVWRKPPGTPLPLSTASNSSIFTPTL